MREGGQGLAMLTAHILNWMRLPEFKNIGAIDDYSASLLHREVIQKKPFLKKLYTDFYLEMKNALPDIKCGEIILELGSGGGFIEELIPGAVTSDVLALPHIRMSFSALQMPFKDNAVKAFLMRDVLHHIDDAHTFFNEISRCLAIGGRVIMIEPSNTIFNRFIYTRFHCEGFDPFAGWSFKKDSHLFSANGALPWIIFIRDRRYFEKKFSYLKILKIRIHTTFRCLLSGGVSMRALAPPWAYPVIKSLEILLSPLNKYFGMFMTIELVKLSGPPLSS